MYAELFLLLHKVGVTEHPRKLVDVDGWEWMDKYLILVTMGESLFRWQISTDQLQPQVGHMLQSERQGDKFRDNW